MRTQKKLGFGFGFLWVYGCGFETQILWVWVLGFEST
jgi:hypothetical protein